ncbi:MAG: hypothetical protein V1843_02755, partial [bacterium]
NHIKFFINNLFSLHPEQEVANFIDESNPARLRTVEGRNPGLEAQMLLSIVQGKMGVGDYERAIKESQRALENTSYTSDEDTKLELLGKTFWGDAKRCIMENVKLLLALLQATGRNDEAINILTEILENPKHDNNLAVRLGLMEALNEKGLYQEAVDQGYEILNRLENVFPRPPNEDRKIFHNNAEKGAYGYPYQQHVIFVETVCQMAEALASQGKYDEAQNLLDSIMVHAEDSHEADPWYMKLWNSILEDLAKIGRMFSSIADWFRGLAGKEPKDRSYKFDSIEDIKNYAKEIASDRNGQLNSKILLTKANAYRTQAAQKADYDSYTKAIDYYWAALIAETNEKTKDRYVIFDLLVLKNMLELEQTYRDRGELAKANASKSWGADWEKDFDISNDILRTILENLGSSKWGSAINSGKLLMDFLHTNNSKDKTQAVVRGTQIASAAGLTATPDNRETLLLLFELELVYSYLGGRDYQETITQCLNIFENYEPKGLDNAQRILFDSPIALMSALTKEGRFNEAYFIGRTIVDPEEAKKIDKTGMAPEILAYAELLADRELSETEIKAGIKTLDDVFTTDPTMKMKVLKNMASMASWVEVGNYDLSIELYKEVLNINPHDIEAMLGLSGVYTWAEPATDYQDNYEEASTLSRQALAQLQTKFANKQALDNEDYRLLLTATIRSAEAWKRLAELKIQYSGDPNSGKPYYYRAYALYAVILNGTVEPIGEIEDELKFIQGYSANLRNQLGAEINPDHSALTEDAMR